MTHPIISRPLQSRFLDIPQTPLAYWLRERFFELLGGRTLGDVADVARGLDTSNLLRYARCNWECSALGERWVSFFRGGKYQKWAGVDWSAVDWQFEGVRIKGSTGAAIRNERLYFRVGYVYTFTARGSIGLRWNHDGGIFAGGFSSACIPRYPDCHVAALLNCRAASYLVRSLSAKIQLTESYVSRVPFAVGPSTLFQELELICIALKRRFVSFDPIERTFDPSSFLTLDGQSIPRPAESVLHAVEGFLEHLVFVAYRLDTEDTASVLEETGTPAGWFSLIVGYDALPPLPSRSPPLPSELSEFLRQHQRVGVKESELGNLQVRLRRLFEAGPGASQDDREPNEEGEDDDTLSIGACIPIPTETFLEELSQRLQIHPISIYWLLKEGIEQHGWRCFPEEQRLARDRVTVMVLRLLGHRWPKQIEAGEPVPEWADADGIIPLTEGGSERTLFERVVERNSFRSWDVTENRENGGNGDAGAGNGMNSVLLREFAELMGKPLDQWLATEFFKHHVNQFKKRPIAWQVQSGRFTSRSKPAFACFVYYHKLDADLLEKIRTQYAGPLRQRFDTELRGIESVAPAARSDRQTARCSQLADLIKELQDFDARLQTVQASAFCDSHLRQYAIQDALLCMKAYWLRRLSDAIQAGPLPKWKIEASRAEIHLDLPDWVDLAMHDMNYFCSQVGPERWESLDDPTSRTLAAMICSDCDRMVTASLRLANRRWHNRVDEVLIKPLREELSRKREALKAVAAELQQLSRHEQESKLRLHDEEDRLKREIKVLNQEIGRIKVRVERLRSTIEDWRCHEAAGWEPWLAQQPMYDPISSVDGRRRPPITLIEWVAQESAYHPDINDGVRVNIAPLQKAGLLAADVLAKKDVDKAIADRAQWRADERRWCREGKLPQPGWWPEG